jgi:hypothetical protein
MTSRRGRTGLTVLAVIAAIAATASLSSYAAARAFSDVSGFFADPVDNITDAGCATGFGDGTFRPKDGATRGQFAYWLNNCGGRTAVADTPNTAAIANDWVDIDNPNITIGGDTGLTQYLNVNAWLEVDDDGNECPCDLEMRFLLDADGTALDQTSETTKHVIIEGSGGDIDHTIAMSWQFPVVPSVVYNLRSQARVFGATTTPASITTSASHLSAITAPFGFAGGNPAAAIEGSEETPDAVLHPSGNPNG